jgi:hypothetical protein
MSLSVRAGRLSWLSGRLMPLSPASFSPLSRAWVISTSTPSGSTRRITPPMRPSSNQMRSPTQTWANTSGSVQATDGIVVISLPRTRSGTAAGSAPARVSRKTEPRSRWSKPSPRGSSVNVVRRGFFPL